MAGLSTIAFLLLTVYLSISLSINDIVKGFIFIWFYYHIKHIIYLILKEKDDNSTYLPSLKYVFRVSLKLLEYFTNSFF